VSKGELTVDILRKIEEYAACQGERTAFRSRTGEISYGELWERSGRLASVIENLMCDNRDPVIVYGHKDPLMIVSFIACIRSGRAYCPVDINTPAERITQISEKIGEPLVLMAEKTSAASEIEKREMFTGSRWVIGYETIRELTQSGKITTSLSPCSGEDDFYIIFTSGTTGKPKGVRITANDLNNYLAWAVSLAGGIEERAVFMNQAPYSFDLSVMDLYLSLATGGTVVSVDRLLQKDSYRLMDYLSGQGINYWVSTPSFADICLAEECFDAEFLPELKAFLFCGEVLPCETAKRLIKRFPDSKVINTYGPTESTVCVTEIQITEEMASGNEPLPVGKVRPGTAIELDPDTSEIIIIGDTVSPGYYKEPMLTSKHFFFNSPLRACESAGTCQTVRSGGLRAYRTGDKGHFDEDGNLYCDGRIDNQIKLHGYRIEIEDIEANLATVCGVKRGAVAQRTCDGKAESLTAFVIREGDLITDDYFGRKAVRTALREKMPSYMVPKRIVFLDKLPVTNNGKLDRKRLREMA
jgi:D-alanine--poly(phosphoribitol) ligase subunit 1